MMSAYFREMIVYSKHDMKETIRLNHWKLLLVVVLFLLFYLDYLTQLRNLYEDGVAERSFLSAIIYIFHGMKEYVPSDENKFEIPYTWLGIQIYLGYLIGNYTKTDMQGIGQQYLVRSVHKSCWMIGKTIYVLVNVILFYGIGYLTIFITSVLSGSSITAFHVEQAGYICGVDYSVLSRMDFVVGILILPILTSFAISEIQLVLSLIMKSIYSFGIICINAVLSAYFLRYYFIGNFSMIVRSLKVVGDNTMFGLRCFVPAYAIMINITLILIAYLSGIHTLRKYDYLSRS